MIGEMGSVEQKSQFTGIAGELRVMSELLLRGYNPAKSYLDGGVDLILENGLKIQVKTAYPSGKDGVYHFGFMRKSTKVKDGKWVGKEVANNDLVDFIICWAAGTDNFWTIPSGILRGKSGIGVKPMNQKVYKHPKVNKYEIYANNWNLLKGGER